MDLLNNHHHLAKVSILGPAAHLNLEFACFTEQWHGHMKAN